MTVMSSIPRKSIQNFELSTLYGTFIIEFQNLKTDKDVNVKINVDFSEHRKSCLRKPVQGKLAYELVNLCTI